MITSNGDSVLGSTPKSKWMVEMSVPKFDEEDAAAVKAEPVSPLASEVCCLFFGVQSVLCFLL